jgi:uncharacterized protein (DUF362 family)
MSVNSQSKDYRVRAVHCDYQASDEEVYQALKRATDPLDLSWARLEKAGRIGIKFNQDWNPTRLKVHQGHRQQLVSDPVARATLRLLRERTKAEIFVVDVAVEPVSQGETRLNNTHVLPILREFDVPYIDGNFDRVDWVQVPGGGQMFEKYPVPHCTTEADEMISVQKMKNHAFMGVTLSLKNLFGLLPLQPLGRPRGYYHHLVRMPYLLADLGRTYNPVLNIIDGLVCQAGEEWGKGENPRICNTLVAGDQTIATDACTTYLMGHDPQSDWLIPPFHRDRNAILAAAEGGFGTANLEEVDFQSEVQAPVGEFFTKQYDDQETIEIWRQTMSEQGLYFRDHQAELVSQFAGEYILLQQGEVRWHDREGVINVSRRQLAGDHPEQGMWLKFVDPDEMEGEHFEVYEQTLESMKNMGVYKPPV